MENRTGAKKFSQTSSASASSTSAKESAPGSGKRLVVTDIAGSADNSGATLEVIEDEGGTPTTLFTVNVDSGNFVHRFKTPLVLSDNKSASVKVSGGTSDTKANLSGLIINN